MIHISLDNINLSQSNVFYSTMSTGLNSMCGVIFEDLIRPAIKRPISEKNASLIMKLIVVVVGMYMYKLQVDTYFFI